MSTEHILALLVAERNKLNRAIEALGTSAARRGRPGKNSALTLPGAASSGAKAPRRKIKRSAAQRKAQAERMRAYWAAKRKKQSKQ